MLEENSRYLREVIVPLMKAVVLSNEHERQDQGPTTRAAPEGVDPATASAISVFSFSPFTIFLVSLTANSKSTNLFE